MTRIPRYAPELEVSVIALRKSPDPGPFVYLQGVRSGALRLINPNVEETEVARSYYRNESLYCTLLASAVPRPFDALISPPSRFASHTTPYRKAIAEGNIGVDAIDLSSSISRTGKAMAGAGDKSPALEGALSYEPNGAEGAIRRLVIVDDIFATGTTAAAVIKRLYASGLRKDCEVICACPLWLLPTKKDP